MEIVKEVLSLVGAALILSVIVVLISMLIAGCRSVRGIVRDYHSAKKECNSYGYHNFHTLAYLALEVKRLQQRVYKAERVSSNAAYCIACHQKDYKHTKTAKKVALDKARKKAEEDTTRRGGDGM